MIEEIFTGHLVRLEEIVAISGVMVEHRLDADTHGAITRRKLYVEIHLRGSVIRHEARQQEFFTSYNDESQQRDWETAVDELSVQRDQLAASWLAFYGQPSNLEKRDES